METVETAESVETVETGLANVARLFCSTCGAWIPHVYVERPQLNAFLYLLCKTVEVWRMGQDGKWVITKRKAS